MTDNDGAPQVQPEWETGPHRDPSDPHVYLPEAPTPAEQRLADVLDRESADAHLAKIALRVWGLALWIGRADGFAKRLRRYLMAGASIAAVNLSTFAIFALNRHDEAIAAREQAAAEERINTIYRAAAKERMDQFRQDIDGLRAVVMRLTGADPLPSPRDHHHSPDSALLVPPDKLSLSSPAKDTDYDLAPHL